MSRIKMRELSPDRFPWSKYDGGTIPIGMAHSSGKTLAWLDRQIIIGYIDGMKLPVRPSSIAVGVLIDFDGFETWAHLDQCHFDEYQESVSLPGPASLFEESFSDIEEVKEAGMERAEKWYKGAMGVK